MILMGNVLLILSKVQKSITFFFADNLIFSYLRPLSSHFLSAYVSKHSSWPLYLLKKKNLIYKETHYINVTQLQRY